MKKTLKRIISVTLAFMLAIAGGSSVKQNVYAESGLVNHGNVTYGASTVGNFTVNGQQAFCMEHEKTSPTTGIEVTEEIYNDENIRKVLYYGYGGAEQWGGFESAEHGIVATSLTLSHYYAGTAIKSANQSFYDFLQTVSDAPDNTISISKSSLESYVEGGVQRTVNVTLNGDYRNTVTFPLPKNVTLHNVTTGITGTGSVTVSGGQTFYLFAPLSLNTTWNSGELKGSLPLYQPILCKTVLPTVQDVVRTGVFDPTNSISLTVKFSALGKGKLKKVDAKTDKPVAGVQLGIYTDKECTDRVEKLTTDSKGTVTSSDMEPGTYYVKEIKAAEGYVRSGKVYTLKIQAGKTTTLEISNKEQLANLTVIKKGKVLTGWSGTDFTYETAQLSGASFKITAGADIYRADGTKVYDEGDTVKAKVTTGTDGSVTVKNLHLGTYIVTETKTIDGYTINTTPKTVTLSYAGQTVEVVEGSASITNTRQTASVEVVKKDLKTKNPLSGGQYTLYAGNDIKNYDGKVIAKKDTALETATTGTDGKASYTVSLPIGNTYYIKETQAPYGYTRNTTDTYTFTFSDLADTEKTVEFSHTFENDFTTAELHMPKLDRETNKAEPQGDATLEGAVYGLYAKEDITHPDGKTGVLYKKDALVARLTTDKNGKAQADKLYLGKYYLKEITPPEGYVLDGTVYNVTFGYKGDLIPVVEESATVTEQVKKQPFCLIKVSDNGLVTELPNLKGAGFTAYLKSALKYDKDGEPDYENSTPVPLGENGETTIYSDEKGYLESIPLPYGTYVVVESVVPHNMTPVNPFEVKVTEHKPDTPQTWRVFSDKEFTAKLKIVKQDEETGKTILLPDTEFKIFNLDSQSYVVQYTTYPSKVRHETFKTDGSGTLTLPERLPVGNYRIEEVDAPDGYLLDEDGICFSVDTDTAYEVDEDTDDIIITSEYPDTSVKGELTIEKEGEALKDHFGSIYAGTQDKDFRYEKTGLAGAEFEVYAAEDICTPDHQTDEDGNRTKFYSKGELVSTLATDEDGKAVLKDLPLGTYRIVETKAPYGHILNKEEQTVTFAYVDEYTPVIQETVSFTNERQKVSLSVKKTDAETGKAVEGAEFSLYAKEDIVNSAGKTIVTADTLLATAVTDEDGTAAFDKDLPFGTYYAKETKIPQGYVSTEETIEFSPSYQGQDVKTVTIETAFENTPTTVEFTKTDLTGEKELDGARLTVTDLFGNIIDTWVSEAGKAHTIKNLTAGKTYLLKEETAPEGYATAESIRFTVEDTGKVQKVSMKDDSTKVEFTKTDLTGKQELDGAELTVTDKDGNVIDTWISEAEKPHIIGNLTAGETYTLTEKSAPEGYATAESINFKVKDTGEVQKVAMKDAPITVEISKTDITGKEELDGAKLTVTDKNGKTVDTWKSKAGKAHIIKNLKVGETYTLTEKTAPKGYTLSESVKFKVKDTGEVQKVTMKDKYTKGKVEIRKTDAKTGKPLAGVGFELRDAEGNVLETLVTDKDGKAESKEYPIGTYKNGSFQKATTYTVVETKTLEGYILDEKPQEVTFRWKDGKEEVLKATLELTNEPTEPKLPQTGEFPYWMLFTGAGALLAGASFIGWKYSRKKKDE